MASIASLPFRDCSVQGPIVVDTVYAQRTPAFLNFTLVAHSSVPIQDASNVTGSAPLLSTIFAPTSILTFTLNSQSQSAFCATLRPHSPLPAPENGTVNYCPLSPGPIAFAVGTPLTRPYELMTLNTRIRVVDTSSPAQELACVQVAATPLHPRLGSVYGHAVIIFWGTVALAIAYWLVVGAGRLAAASKRGRQRVHNNTWSRVQGLGFVLASAISGERFASSPALMRFGTPSLRDVIFHSQWCTLLGMVAVQWPRFTYPFFAQTAWTTLLYNITLTQGSNTTRWNPLHTDPFNPPPAFADQLVDPLSPLFLNTTIPNSLFTLPSETTGIPALAAAVGLRPQDLFDNAVALFLAILAATILLSLFIFAIDWFVVRLAEPTGTSGTKSPTWPNKESDHPFQGVRFLNNRGWLSHPLGQSSFHGSVLHGNLVRILILFHLPLSIFSAYQFSEGKSHSSLAAVILAALAFALFSIAIPAWLVLRLTTTPTSKLYDETRTLLALGPLYNHYGHGSQLFACLFFASNIAYGLALGCGQRSGTAQSIIILVIEVASALTTSVWLPWGRGAAMGGISFILCVARIITAVLLVILSPVVSVGDAAGGWIAYAILFIQGLVYLALVLMLIAKITEGLVRLIWDLSFDRSKHTVDTGLFGAIGLARGRKQRTRARTRAPSRPASDATTHNMLPPVMPHADSRTSVSGPPSVLRPEQLTQPYREDSDDEGGYILGAWRYDDEPESPVAPPPPPPPLTGFSRVAGGRANMHSPFTMASAPGATAPAPIREDAAALYGAAGTGASPGVPAPAAQGSFSAKRKRKGWLGGLFTSSSSSRGEEGDGGADAMPMLPDVLPAGSGGGSFVVIRDRRPSPLSQAGRMYRPSSAAGPSPPSSPPAIPPRSSRR